MAYADDILITTCTRQSLMDTFQQLKNYSLEVRLTINKKKTKYLKCTRKDIKIENSYIYIYIYIYSRLNNTNI